MFTTDEVEKDGKQSKSLARLDLLPPKAIFRIGSVLKAGAERYGEWNWLDISTSDHINHALIHLLAHLANDDKEDHLTHAACRIIFALEKFYEGYNE